MALVISDVDIRITVNPVTPKPTIINALKQKLALNTLRQTVNLNHQIEIRVGAFLPRIETSRVRYVKNAEIVKLIPNNTLENIAFLITAQLCQRVSTFLARIIQMASTI